MNTFHLFSREIAGDSTWAGASFIKARWYAGEVPPPPKVPPPRSISNAAVCCRPTLGSRRQAICSHRPPTLYYRYSSCCGRTVGCKARSRIRFRGCSRGRCGCQSQATSGTGECLVRKRPRRLRSRRQAHRDVRSSGAARARPVCGGCSSAARWDTAGWLLVARAIRGMLVASGTSASVRALPQGALEAIGSQQWAGGRRPDRSRHDAAMRHAHSQLQGEVLLGSLP